MLPAQTVSLHGGGEADDSRNAEAVKWPGLPKVGRNGEWKGGRCFIPDAVRIRRHDRKAVITRSKIGVVSNALLRFLAPIVVRAAEPVAKPHAPRIGERIGR